MKLEDVANVMIGVLVNREQDSQGEFEYSLLNIKGSSNDSIIKSITTNKNLDRKLTRVGDIIFQLTYPNKIWYIDESLKDFLVTSQMCIIRPNEEILDPRYLKWYLESENGSEQIFFNVRGSSIKKISVNDLRKIKIPILNMEKQKNIKDLIVLWENEKNVLQALIEKKEFLYGSIIIGIVNDFLEDNEDE